MSGNRIGVREWIEIDAALASNVAHPEIAERYGLSVRTIDRYAAVKSRNRCRIRWVAMGLCANCGQAGAANGTQRCESCGEQNRAKSRAVYRPDRKQPVKAHGKSQVLDLADRQAIKRGEPPEDDGEAPVGKPLEITSGTLVFIRSQKPEAIPLLMRFYRKTREEIEEIRARGGGSRGERIPLKMLQELVEQREEEYRAEDYLCGESSIALCAG